MGLSMAGQVAGHNAETAAARDRNNAKARNNYIKQREYEIQANLDNVKYLSDVQEQDYQQDLTYAAMLDQWSETDFELKKLFATKDLEIEEKIAKMHQGGASEQTGASAARATIGKDVLELGRAKAHAIHEKMMATKETEMAKTRQWRAAKNDSHKLFMDVAFAPVHGFAPPEDRSFERGPSKAGLVLGLAQTGFQGFKDYKANKADPVGKWKRD
tara:strand:+ start:49 stop:693 length:645 start_codon:yes stop_codon:yes gene_type:complete